MQSKVFKACFLVGILFSFSLSWAAEPDGYYQSAYGKGGYTLKTALYNIIKDHTVVSYDGLWEAFKRTDVRSNGKMWDMYSNCDFTFDEDKCGNYKDECDCYNREHSFPKSWFDDGKPMYSDLFHLYPTDGKVNGMRSNNPFGEVSNPTYTSHNGSKLGNNSTPGYSGKVFEPIDEYKGDFARSYFYMATRYEDRIANWSSCPVCDGNNKASFKQWTVDLLLEWHRRDPVSQKEKDRNDAVYSYQHNRNPFIDYPELVEKIWGNDNTVFDPGNPNPPDNPDDPDDPRTKVTYELFYEYYDAEGNTLTDGTMQLFANAGKADEETVIFDEDFPEVVDKRVDDGTPATEENTGAKYVEAFDGKVYVSGTSAVRLGAGSGQGSVVFKEFNVNGGFTVNISGKGWGASEKEFTLKCEGCTQASQTISFTQTKEDLPALDEYETLNPVELSANGKVRLTITAAGKPRVIIDRVKVTSGNGGGIPDDPDEPESVLVAKVVYPANNQTVANNTVKARVALVDKDGIQNSVHDLPSVELPENGDYSLYVMLWENDNAVNEDSVKFTYVKGEDPIDPDTLDVEKHPLRFALYPNPSSGNFVVETADESLVEVLTLQGIPVFRLEGVAGRREISLRVSGMYLVRVTDKKGTAVQRMVVK